MADSLRLKGTKHVINQTGDEFKLRRPKRGGDVHMVPRWWAMKKTVTYVNAAIFDVQTSGGPLAMIIPADAEATDISIIADGDGNFIFPIHRCVDRVAIMAPDLSVFYEEYQFAKISGGPVLRRTVNTLPSGGPVTYTGLTQLTGTPQVGTDVSFVAAPYTGGSNVTAVECQVQQSNTGTGGWTGFSGWETSPGTAFLNAGVEGKYVRGVTRVIDDNGTVVGGQTAALGPITPSNYSVSVAGADLTYVVTVDNGNFELDGVANESITASAGQTIYFDLSDVSNATHPLKIYTDSTKTTEVTVGIEMSAEDQSYGLTFTPPITGTFSYQCASHSNMGGTITIN